MKSPVIRCNAALVASFILSVLASCGWGIYVVGFGIRTSWNGTVIQDVLTLQHTCWWAVAVCGPVLFLFALLVHHLVFHSCTSVLYLCLSLFYFAVASCVAQAAINTIYVHSTLGSPPSSSSAAAASGFGFHVVLEFVGVCVSLIFLALSMIVQFTFLTRYFNKPTKFTYDPS